MKVLRLVIFFTMFLGIKGFAQTILPVEYRVEKQSMSTPMSPIDDMLFARYYYSKPVNVKFDGSILNLYYDNGVSFIKKNVSKVKTDAEYEDNVLISERISYTDNTNLSDTIIFVVDYNVGYVQVVLPTKDSKGEYVGYTSFLKFTKDNELALR